MKESKIVEQCANCKFFTADDITIECDEDPTYILLTGDVTDEADNCSVGLDATYADAVDNTALVYIYRLATPGLDANNYRIYVDHKYTHQLLKANEYFPFHIKAGDLTISAMTNSIIEHKIAMNLETKKEYFLKITPIEGGDFTLKEVSQTQAINELAATQLSGSEIKEDPTLSKVVDNTKTTQVSASDEITKLYEMKEKGIITEAEYQKLKAKVIAK